jgi:hypothetical protein
MRLIASSAIQAALLLCGCAGTGLGDQPVVSIAHDLRRHSDKPIVLAYPDLMRRDGAVLTVRGVTFADEGDCNQGDCTRYRADQVWHGEYLGINVTYYEGSDYFLVIRNGIIPIGSRPIPSPSGKRFFIGQHNDREWSPYQGPSVWAWEPTPRRLRVVDTDLVTFDSFVGWRGDSCIEFVGARGYNTGLQPLRTFWLAEQSGDWQLLEKRSEICLG